jgi:hypothetical protein
VTEPLIVSPFIWSGLHDEQSMGFLGINTIGLNINLDSELRRVWSTMSSKYNAASNADGQYLGIRPGAFGARGSASATLGTAVPCFFKTLQLSAVSVFAKKRTLESSAVSVQRSSRDTGL